MSRYTKQVKPKQNKSFKSKPVSEGGLGLSPRTGSGSIDSDIQKAKENVLAKYWYDKYTDLVKEVSHQRKLDRQNLNELDEKMKDMNEGLLTEIATKTDSDALAPLDQKFVTFEKLTEHYKVFIGRIQEQIATIGGGGIGGLVDETSPQLGGDLELNSKDITGTGNITHTGNITTTGNNSVSGTLGVTGVTTHEDDVVFTGANTNMRWDNSTSDLKLFDNTRLEFGSNKDFEIWHGGSHTFMKNSGGDLRIRGDVIKLAREDSSERYIECNVNSAVQIFHNGTEALSTTTSGIQVGASNTNATITTNGTGDLTISTNGGTDSGTIKIEDGANQNITIEPNGTGDILLNGEVGIGSMSGQTVDSVVHIRDADATLTLQRVGDTGTPGITFQSNGGNARAKIYMDGTDGTNKEIVFENKVDTTMAEKFRVTLGGAKVTGNFEATGAQVDFGGLPTSDPSVAGRLWNDSGAVKVSAG